LAALELVPCCACGAFELLCEAVGVVDAVAAGAGSACSGAAAVELLFAAFTAAGSEVAGPTEVAALSPAVVGVIIVTPKDAVGAVSGVPTLSVSTAAADGAAPPPEPTRAAPIPTLNVGPGAS